jgi:hypothetical protein
MNRLNQLPTLRINPSEKRSLNYRGKTYQGVAGDTVATALFANGVRVFARSLKYHRPRGLYSLDGECSNTCMDVNGVPNVRTENTPLERRHDRQGAECRRIGRFRLDGLYRQTGLDDAGGVLLQNHAQTRRHLAFGHETDPQGRRPGRHLCRLQDEGQYDECFS